MANADKRSVATDALETLGTVIGDGEARDAIHLAVEPVIASTTLKPGQDIGIVVDQGKTYATPDAKHLGIVDPFLTADVNPGEQFWLVVYPRQIKSLRHVWEHPDFPASQDVVLAEEQYSDAEKWIRRFAEINGLTYHDLMEGAKDWLNYGDYLNRGGLLEGTYVPDEFWDHYEELTGLIIDSKDKGSFFTCSC